MTGGDSASIGELVPYIAGALIVGGIAVGLSRRRELILRWCARAVAVPVVVGALYLGPPGAAVLVAAVGVVCAGEYARLARLPTTDRVAISAAVVGLAAAAWQAPAHLPRALGMGLLAVALVPLLAGDTSGGFRRLAFGVLGLVWLAPLVVVVNLGATALALFAAVSVADIGAYFGGRLLRGPHLSPLSPAKRWSGVLVGAVAGLATLPALGALHVPSAVAVAVGAPVGDLIESMVKRGAGVKDAAGWLAGSGGLLDRLDSLLLALAVVALLA
ncbi:MAG TPA: phosphatidate cytidylyltransferase [Micromonosporaceae bacterium]|nr:phosphatidate cytidylyltransferase [Micromonosporaceae bacterium]